MIRPMESIEWRMETGPDARSHRVFHSKISLLWLAFCNLRTRWDLGVRNCTEGSNPAPSARQSELQRILASFRPRIRELCQFFAILTLQVGLRRRNCHCDGRYSSGLFLRKPDEQSDLDRVVGRRFCDRKLSYPPTRVDFLTTEFPGASFW
jgi:hypothetical protein